MRVQKAKQSPKKYGEKVDIYKLPEKHLVSSKTENGKFIQIYQYKAWNKEMATFLLNVVSIIATDEQSGKVYCTHFFFTNPLLSAENMVHYYSLHFQIEFDFRDAKQLFGLYKLKNFNSAQMINMFHLAFLALQCAKIWQKYWATKLNSPKNSLLDMKAIFKAQWNLKNAIKLAENDPNLFFNPKFIPNFVPEDMINAA